MPDTQSIISGGNHTSDILTMQTDTVAAYIQVKGSNQGVEDIDDITEFRLLDSLGDSDSGGDDYATIKQANIIDRLDTYTDNPATSTGVYVSPCKALKVYADNEGLSAVIVSAVLFEIAPDGSQTSSIIQWTP